MSRFSNGLAIPRNQSRCITLDIVKFVGKMLAADSKQDQRTLLVIYYERIRNLYSCTERFSRTLPMRNVRVVLPIN